MGTEAFSGAILIHSDRKRIEAPTQSDPSKETIYTAQSERKYLRDNMLSRSFQANEKGKSSK